jgi:hypothetical protein
MTLTLATSEAVEYFSNQEYQIFISVGAVRSAVLMAASRYSWLRFIRSQISRLFAMKQHTGCYKYLSVQVWPWASMDLSSRCKNYHHLLLPVVLLSKQMICRTPLKFRSQ